jgi:hypothetical protein
MAVVKKPEEKPPRILRGGFFYPTNVQQGILVPVAALRGDRIEPGGEIT